MKTLLSITTVAFAIIAIWVLAAMISAPEKPARFVAIEAFPDLSFESPIEFMHAGDGTNRLFVVEQPGVIKVFDRAAKKPSVFLDIAKNVKYGGEMGLLGLAFHPEFKKNGYFYLNYNRDKPLRTVISRFKVSKDNPNQVDPASEQVLLTFNQPYSNHNGGKLAFGPDGLLYIATGDGGSGGDPHNNGQNKATFLGKILRIDVNTTDDGLAYGIPKDNPFVNDSRAKGEIYAYGLRNPWRFSFDAQTKQLWAGDVGQNELEEIDIITKGGNYGWRVKEAKDCFNPKRDCAEKNLTDPVLEYNHANGDVSVTGGAVYRGKKIPALQGKYIYADYASGRVWALTHDGAKAVKNELLFKHAGTISAFGEDAERELYFCDHGNGKILSLAGAGKQ